MQHCMCFQLFFYVVRLAYLANNRVDSLDSVNIDAEFYDIGVDLLKGTIGIIALPPSMHVLVNL